MCLQRSCRNEPNVHKSSQLPNKDSWHGAELSLTIEGNWTYYRSKILKYLRQIAVITPYAQVYGCMRKVVLC
jgi:DNA topoisomerase VI subunit B